MSESSGRVEVSTPQGPVHRYKAVARSLHWIVAALVLLVWTMGFMISFVREDVKLNFYMVHESFGFLVLLIMLLRAGYRARNPPPELVPMPEWRRRAALYSHRALYTLLVLQPILGFLATNAHGFPLEWFWLVPIPSPIGEMPDLAPYLSIAHFVGGWTILTLVVLHVGAALTHHLFRRDGTLYRML